MSKTYFVNPSTHKRHIITAIILSALLAISATTLVAHYAYSQAISNPGTTYGPGDVDSCAYIVYEDGGSYYAKNGTTRAIDYSGTNASQIIQNALDSLTSGRTAEEKVVLRGDMTLTHTISLPNYLELEIQGKLTWDGTGNMFEGIGTDLAANRKVMIEIHGGKIFGDYTDANQADLLHFELATDIHIHDIRISGARDDGIDFYRVFGLGTGINNAMIDSCVYGAGIYLNRSNTISIACCDLSSNMYGIYLFNAGEPAIRDTNIENTGIGAGGYGDGIYIANGFGALIENVWMEGYKRYSVYITDGLAHWGWGQARNVRIINSIFDAGSADAAYDNNLVIDNATNTLIEGCYFQTCPVAIKLNVAANFTDIRKNTCDYVTYLVNNTGSNTRYWRNWGWHDLGGSALNLVTENWGTAEASNDDWIAHGLAGDPADNVRFIVEETDANYCIQLKATNASHFRIYLYDLTAGASETVDKTINWHAEYQPQSGTVP